LAALARAGQLAGLPPPRPSGCTLATRRVYLLATRRVYPLATRCVYPLATRRVYPLATRRVYPLATRRVYPLATRRVNPHASTPVLSVLRRARRACDPPPLPPIMTMAVPCP